MILVITGGTGSLGKAILQEQDLLKKYVKKIRVLSRDEVKQAELVQRYSGKVPLDCYLADVTDNKRMEFGLCDASFVVHAAAQKRIEKFEVDIPTGYKTNITGTQNVAEGFIKSKKAISGIFVSTDKASDPTTSYGVSKLASEHLWLWNNTFQKEVSFGVTRYGNIFGSRGSVIETWSRLSKLSKPLPITDYDCTRYFMEIKDAAKFVLKNLFAESTKLAIPRMKSAFMTDVASVIWKYHNPKKPVLLKSISMRGIEKVHESLESGLHNSLTADKFEDEEIEEMYKNYLSSQC